jgi:cytochrome c oxidase cbb3-type subunit III
MAEFDGIKERAKGKKKMPIGMAVLFIGLVVFGLLYLYLFLPQTTGWTQKAHYEAQVKAHEAITAAQHKEVEGAESKEHELMETLARGEKIYKENCAMCHGEKLEGSGAAPALTGPKFVYGTSIEDHIRVISKGTQKGMPAFERQLGAANLYNVAYFIHTRHKR